LPEVVVYLGYEFDRRTIVIKRQFITRTPLENTKEGKIKDLEDLTCVWCRSYNAHPWCSEDTDHISADMSTKSINVW
jgi:hypothetical protein